MGSDPDVRILDFIKIRMRDAAMDGDPIFMIVALGKNLAMACQIGKQTPVTDTRFHIHIAKIQAQPGTHRMGKSADPNP